MGGEQKQMPALKRGKQIQVLREEGAKVGTELRGSHISIKGRGPEVIIESGEYIYVSW